MSRRVQELFDQMEVDIDVNKRVCDVGVAYKQIVEILKAVARNPKFIILDEPTASLTLKETEIFFNVIRKLKENNCTILFISHRLEEIFEMCDRAAIFMDGKFVTMRDVESLKMNELISLMVGRDISGEYPSPKNHSDEVILECKHLKNAALKDVSFKLHKGEILGFGGLVGAGRTELARAIFGADPLTSGEITFKGRKYTPKSPRKALSTGIGLIPEDRKSQGVLLSLTIKENTVYSSMPKYLTCGFVISGKKERSETERYIRELKIKTPGMDQLSKNLSGGNQQKVVLARILSTECDVLIFDEPTRGIDVAAKQEIYNLMCKLADSGKSIIMISSEMPELIGVADRVVVMYEGAVSGELRKKELTQDKIMHLASIDKSKLEENIS